MAEERITKRRRNRWFLTIQITLCLFTVFAEGFEDVDEANGNGRNLMLEFFLPIDLSNRVQETMLREREKRDIEGSGDDDDTVLRSATEKAVTQHPGRNATELEGSGDGDGDDGVTNVETSSVPIIGDSELLTTSVEGLVNESENASTETNAPDEVTTEGDVAVAVTTTTTTVTTTMTPEGNRETTTTTTEAVPETTSYAGDAIPNLRDLNTESGHVDATTTASEPEKEEEEEEEAAATTTTTTTTTEAVIVPKVHVPNEAVAGETKTDAETTSPPPPQPPQGPDADDPVVEPVLTETKLAHKTVEASPGNILQKKNMTLGVDPLLIITNTGMMESDEAVQAEQTDSRRLGAYIVIGLILLSFSSLVGYIAFRKSKSRKRQDLESSPESHETEKALLSLSDYKDNSELEENHLKNNEITPIVVKSSNPQINKFEKNTNFSSQKNLNTIANEKNLEKDNVLKSADALTQVIIEDPSAKDSDDEKNSPTMEKLIVKTLIDEDSIPKKPILVNRSSSGYIPIPQENV